MISIYIKREFVVSKSIRFVAFVKIGTLGEIDHKSYVNDKCNMIKNDYMSVPIITLPFLNFFI